ncbi:MAG: CBS domain-containing protein [Desulfobulbaceae bacterium]|uniref:CBS domain-containing protein n=1 Tax=Candidatus Desulfobia pelagia TaxID=2841692 RepID=A0A8J6TCV4_9BACT|nr:CBS domain-containing protein [Candidatus Desulfobia pelagia]
MASDTLLVKDVLIPIERYPHLNENKSLYDAVQEFREFTVGEKNRLRYAEMLVVNDKNQLVGKIDLNGVLHALAPSLFASEKVGKYEGMGSDFPNLVILLEESFLKTCAEQRSVPVKDFMSEIKTTVTGDTPMLKTLMLMMNEKNHTFPVVEGNKVIGVIRLEEIFLDLCGHCKL